MTYDDARRTIRLIVLLLLAWALLSALQPVVILFAIVFLLAMMLNPLVNALERRKWPRALSTAVIILGGIILGVGLIWAALPPVLDQVQELGRRATEAWIVIRQNAQNFVGRHPIIAGYLPDTEGILNALGAQAGGIATFLLRSTVGIAGGIFATLFCLLLLFFVLSNPQPLVAAVLKLVPDNVREQTRRTIARMSNQTIAWARGVAINGAITGISTGGLLWLIGVQPAFVFGALAFMGEFVPNIGPFMVALPALFVALSMGMTKFALALVVILFVQQVETNLLVPYVMGREMKLNPVLILFATVAMASIFGLAGAVLALPAAALVKILVDEFYLRPRNLDHKAIEKEASDLVAGRAKF